MTPKVAPLISQTFPTSWGGPNPLATSKSPSWNGAPTARSGTPSPSTSPTTAIENPKYVVEDSGFGSSSVVARVAVTKSIDNISGRTISSAPWYLPINLAGDNLVAFSGCLSDCKLIWMSSEFRSLILPPCTASEMINARKIVKFFNKPWKTWFFYERWARGLSACEFHGPLFVTEDVGKAIVSDNFPPGTTIVSRTSSTVVQTSAAATKTPTRKPVAFSILTRNPRGAAFRVLTAPDQGVMPIGKPRFCRHCRKEITPPFSTERTARAVWLSSKSTTCRKEPETISRPGTLAENVALMAKRFRILTGIASEERGRPESSPVKSRS